MFLISSQRISIALTFNNFLKQQIDCYVSRSDMAGFRNCDQAVPLNVDQIGNSFFLPFIAGFRFKLPYQSEKQGQERQKQKQFIFPQELCQFCLPHIWILVWILEYLTISRTFRLVFYYYFDIHKFYEINHGNFYKM